MKTSLLLMAMTLPLIQGCAGQAHPRTAPTLQPTLLPLAGFIGSRRCAGSFLKSGKAISSTETVSPELSGYWLVLRHTDEPPFSFDALEMWGYDPKSKHFIAYMYDNFGGAREFDSQGWQGDSFTWTNVNTSTPKWDRFVFERQAGGGYRFTYEVNTDGSHWTGVDSMLCVSAVSSPGGA